MPAKDDTNNNDDDNDNDDDDDLPRGGGEEKKSAPSEPLKCRSAPASPTHHLRVLEQVGVVVSTKVGRESRFALDPRPIVSAQEYLEHVARQWDTALARLKALVEEP